MRRIDAHQHFWSYDPLEYPWIKAEWPICKTFLPADLAPLLARTGLDSAVAVQARQTLEETAWLLALAKQDPIVAGVVGWVDLRAANVDRQLEQFAGDPKFVGVRHVVQDEPDDSFLLGPEFVQGISRLERFNLAYDLLVFPKQLPAAIELVRRFPQQRFVLDHIAKPFIKDAVLEPWATYLQELAKAPNCFCKLSGMVTEARWKTWKPEDFRPYLDVVWAAFGPERLMVGSDWPVCLLSAEYQQAMSIVSDYLRQFTPSEQEKVMGGNAIRFYRLPI